MNISSESFQIEGSVASPAGLSKNEVHVWRIDLETVSVAEERWRTLLSPDERGRAERFRFPQHRQYFTATRALLRTLLGAYLSANSGELVFRYTAREKPFLSAGFSGDRIEFNVSHSGGVALMAFAQGRALGVDVEQVREQADHEAIARRFFSENEQHQLAAVGAPERHLAFFRCWTRKEAYIKATGDGLSLPLQDFDVSVDAASGNALLSTRPDPKEALRWSLRDLAAGDGYVAALCVEGQGWKLRI